MCDIPKREVEVRMMVIQLLNSPPDPAYASFIDAPFPCWKIRRKRQLHHEPEEVEGEGGFFSPVGRGK